MHNAAPNAPFDPRKEIANAEGALEVGVRDATAECNFLATLIRRPDWCERARERVAPEQLHSGKNRDVYRMILAHTYTAFTAGYQPNMARDAIVHTTQVTDPRLLRDQEWDQQLEHTLNRAPLIDPQSSPQYVAAILAADRRVRAMAAIRAARDLLLNPAVDPTTALTGAVTSLETLTLADPRAGGQMQRLGDAALDLSGRTYRGICPTAFPFLSDLTRGFRPGTLSLVAARSGVGKSTFLTAVALDAAITQNVPTLIIDSEMLPAEVLGRSVAALSGIDERTLGGGQCQHDPALRQRAEEAHAKIKSAPLIHVSAAGWTIDQVIGAIRRFKKLFVDTHPSGRALVLYDYLKSPGDNGRQPEWQILGEAAAALKAAALDLNLPIVAGLQTNKSALALAQADYANGLGVGTFGGSDRIVHSADLALILRNVSSDEAQRIVARFGPNPNANPNDPRTLPRFNQVMHVVKNRGGCTFDAGVPIFVHYGRTAYTELGFAPGADPANPARSAELEFLHSPEFSRKKATFAPAITFANTPPVPAVSHLRLQTREEAGL